MPRSPSQATNAALATNIHSRIQGAYQADNRRSSAVFGGLGQSERARVTRWIFSNRAGFIATISGAPLGVNLAAMYATMCRLAPKGRAARQAPQPARGGDLRDAWVSLGAKDAALLQAAAIVRLFREGYVGDVKPHRRAAHIYAHQVIALAIQKGGIMRGDIDAWLHGATAFADLSTDERAGIIDHMLTAEILADQGAATAPPKYHP